MDTTAMSYGAQDARVYIFILTHKDQIHTL